MTPFRGRGTQYPPHLNGISFCHWVSFCQYQHYRSPLRDSRAKPQCNPSSATMGFYFSVIACGLVPHVISYGRSFCIHKHLEFYAILSYVARNRSRALDTGAFSRVRPALGKKSWHGDFVLKLDAGWGTWLFLFFLFSFNYISNLPLIFAKY